MTNTRKLQLIIGTLVVVFLIKVVLILLQRGSGWEPDEYMHFLQLKTVFANFPQNLHIGLDIWAKPLYTFPLGIIASILNIQELWPIQVINTALILAVSYLIYLSLRKLGLSFGASYLGLIFVNFSFILFRSSLTGLTEPIFTLFLVGAYYLFLNQRYNWSAILIGISVLGRIEGLLFVAVWFLYLTLSKLSWRRIATLTGIMILPVLLWNLIGFLYSGRVLFLLGGGYATAGLGAYGYGAPTYYVEGLMRFEFIILLLFIISLPLLINWPLSKRNLGLALAADAFVSFLLVQSVLYRFGLFGTAGLMRYFIAVMPLVIIPAIYAFDLIWQKLPYLTWQKYLLILLIISLQLGLSGTTYIRGGCYFGQQSKPVQDQDLVAAGKWVKSNVPLNTSVFADKPEVIYYSERNLEHSNINLQPAWDQRQSGVYVWGVEWGEAIWKLKLNDMKKVVQPAANFNNQVYIFVLR